MRKRNSSSAVSNSDGATRQLELLLGQYADGVFDTPAGLPQITPSVPAGMPADLVARRPDLVAAERELAAFLVRADVARTDLLPRLSLTGATGTATDGLRSLIDGDFGVWSLLGNVVAPLWQGGRLRAEVDRAEARGAEALATYAKALFITVWRSSSRNAENSCGIRRD